MVTLAAEELPPQPTLVRQGAFMVGGITCPVAALPRPTPRFPGRPHGRKDGARGVPRFVRFGVQGRSCSGSSR